MQQTFFCFFKIANLIRGVNKCIFSHSIFGIIRNQFKIFNCRPMEFFMIRMAFLFN